MRSMLIWRELGVQPERMVLVGIAVNHFEAQEDAAGNVVVRVPASPGRERAPAVVLQGHLDMVCEKNSDVAHDFGRDPIVPVIKNGWVQARGTVAGLAPAAARKAEKP